MRRAPLDSIGWRARAGLYDDGYNVYITGGVLFGTIYGGVIFPPYYLP